MRGEYRDTQNTVRDGSEVPERAPKVLLPYAAPDAQTARVDAIDDQVVANMLKSIGDP